jgi:NADH-quinone oxidoreductase subunit A
VNFTAPPSIATYLALAAIAGLVLTVVVGLLSPRKPSVAKSRPYESGISDPISTQTRWPVRFALVAMLFLVFDVETLLFYAWAVVLTDLGWYGIAAIASFFIVLEVGYLYARARGALEWR